MNEPDLKATTALDESEMTRLFIRMPFAREVLEDIVRWATGALELLMDGSWKHQPIGMTAEDLGGVNPKRKPGEIHAALFVLRMAGYIEMRTIEGLQFFIPKATVLAPSMPSQPMDLGVKNFIWQEGDQFYVNQKRINLGSTEIGFFRAVFVRGRKSSRALSELETSSGYRVTVAAARVNIGRIHKAMKKCGVDAETVRRLVYLQGERIFISASAGAPDTKDAPLFPE